MAASVGEIERIINSRVSLTTNSNIRYEGKIIHIAKEEKKITVQDVKQFGTEGRNAEIGAPEIPALPDDKSFPFVEFAIGMIKALKIIEHSPESF
jgi:protein LSM14